MKKILFLTNTPSPYRVDFFNTLGAMDGIDLTVAFLYRPADHTEREKQWFREEYDSFTPVFLDKKIALPKGQYFHPEIRALLKKPYDEIVFCGYAHLSMMYGMRLLKRWNRPFSIEIDGGLVGKDNAVRRRIKRSCISSASTWFSTGEATDEYLIHYGADKNRIIRYPFSSVKESEIADKDALSAEFKTQMRDALGIKEPRVLITVGQFIHRKGFDLLLEAAKDLPSDLGILIVGGKPTQEYLDIVERYHLQNVHFLDFMDKKTLWKYYSAADLFVLPTREDIWGLVVNEAMACGLPVVTTDRCVSGLEMVRNGESGMIVEAGSAESLKQGIRSVLDADLGLMGNNALSTAKKYTIEEMALLHAKVFLGSGR